MEMEILAIIYSQFWDIKNEISEVYQSPLKLYTHSIFQMGLELSNIYFVNCLFIYEHF